MKKNLLYLMGLLFGIVGWVQAGQEPEVFRITTCEWLPVISEEMEDFGPLCRAVKEAFALEGIRVEYGFFPWKRALAYMECGSWDGSICWSQTQERKEYAYYSDALYAEGMHFFHLKAHPFSWKSMEDVAGLCIGATYGCHYGTAFHNAEKAGKIEVSRVTKDLQNLKKLLAGRIHILPLELEAGYAFMNKYMNPKEISRITHHPRCLKHDTYHLIFSKKVKGNKEMVVRFNRGLKRLRESGKLAEYLNGKQCGLLHGGHREKRIPEKTVTVK